MYGTRIGGWQEEWWRKWRTTTSCKRRRLRGGNVLEDVYKSEKYKIYRESDVENVEFAVLDHNPDIELTKTGSEVKHQQK